MPPQKATKPAWTAKFIVALAEGATVTEAAKESGTSRQNAYAYRDRDPEFAAGWDEVYEHGTERLEAEAFRRAVEGVDQPVYQAGKKVGTVRKFSDTLLIFLLKARKPDTYRERISVDDDRERQQRKALEAEDEQTLDKRLTGFDNVTPIRKAS